MKHLLSFQIYNNTIRKIDKLEYVEFDITQNSILVSPPKVDIEYNELPEEVDKSMYSKTKEDYPTFFKKLDIGVILISQNILTKNVLISLALEKITEPLLVCEFENKYYLVDGNHRYCVMYLQGIREVDCKIYKVTS